MTARGNATRVVVCLLGAIVAAAGFEHGVGETLQGSVAPSGVMIQSWPGSAFFSNVNGEPAMTVIPNLLASGVLTMAVSLGFLVWTVWFAQSRYGWTVIAALSIMLLLVGGGLCPPILGIIVAVAATRIGSTHSWWRVHLSPSQRRLIARLWPSAVVACLAAWLMLLPGLQILDYFVGVRSDAAVAVAGLAAVVFLLMALVFGFARDADGGAAIAGGTDDMVGRDWRRSPGTTDQR